MLKDTERLGFLTALVVAVRLKTDYEMANSYFYEYSD